MRHLGMGIEGCAIGIGFMKYDETVVIGRGQYVELMTARFIGKRSAGVFVGMAEKSGLLAFLELKFCNNDKTGGFTHDDSRERQLNNKARHEPGIHA